jgi:hypothetical protein
MPRVFAYVLKLLTASLEPLVLPTARRHDAFANLRRGFAGAFGGDFTEIGLNRISRGEQCDSPGILPSGVGFMVATSMNCEGKVMVPAAREMATRPSSSGCRMVSSTL